MFSVEVKGAGGGLPVCAVGLVLDGVGEAAGGDGDGDSKFEPEKRRREWCYIPS